MNSITRSKNRNRTERNILYKNRILETIRDSEFGITPSQIAAQLSIAWRTVNKYVGELTKEGRVSAHIIGPYVVYSARKLGEQSVYQVLYYGAIKTGTRIVQADGFKPDIIPRYLRETWEELANHSTLPFESDIPLFKGQLTPNDLGRLIDVVNNILCEFGYFGEYPKVETIPPLGTSSPMTRLIRLKDPGFIAAGARIHYYLLAGLLEEKLTQKTGIHVTFRVAREIQLGEEVVYFEIGFVESYHIDICVVEKSDPHKDARFYLDTMKNYFSNFLRMNVREYYVGDALHYDFKLLDNLQVDEFFTFRTKSLRRNAEIFNKLKIKSQRQWLPYEDWPESPFLAVEFVSNVGFAFEDYHHAMMETFPLAGYCIHFEKIPNGMRTNFLESRDFDLLFFNQTDDSAVREHYRRLGITSEEFFKQRQQSIQEILTELQKKRLDKLAQKRKRKVKEEA